jgi:two-component system, chemotaxis family, CheB/CheR fusion protein
MTDRSPRPLRILVVDDHEDSAHAMGALLRRLGHVVTVAHTLAGAVALGTGGAAPDLLLCDINLPDGDGCDLLRRLRADGGGREQAAVAISGFGDEWVERCRGAGFARFLTKPVKFDEVLEAVAATAELQLARSGSGSEA